LGVPGDTTADGLARMSELNAYKPKVVLLLLGGNDYLKRIPQEQTFANLAAIIKDIQSRGAIVLLLGVRGGLFGLHLGQRALGFLFFKVGAQALLAAGDGVALGLELRQGHVLGVQRVLEVGQLFGALLFQGGLFLFLARYLQAPEIIYRIGKYFNDAYAFVENNEIGQQVVDSLAIDFEYDNVFYEKSNLAGYRTTKKTKRLGCSNLKAFVENQKLRIVDIETIQQLSTFVRNTKGSFEAEYGYQDDAIMALIGCLFFLTRPEFDSIKDRKTFINTLFNREEVNDALVEDMPFFGVIDDGSQDDSVF